MKPLIKSTNQQCSATGYSEFLGLTIAPNWKINKSTGKHAINTQALTRNHIQNQQINSDLQPVPLNFRVSHKLSFTKSTNQRENALLILRDLVWILGFKKLHFQKSTNQQENALLILRDLEHNPDKINKSTAICNLLDWIFGSNKSSKLKNQQINRKTRY